MNLVKIILITAYCLVGSTAFSQGNSDPYKNRVILKHYTVTQLQDMENNYPEKFNYVKYYYIHSYFTTAVPCTACEPFDISLVDVKDYESQRLQDERITITDSIHGFSITLLSQNEFQNILRTAGTLQPAGIGQGGVK